MTLRVGRLVTVLLVLAVTPGCASWFLRGAEMASAAPRTPTAVYTVPVCVMANGASIAGPTATYYLAEEVGGTVLYEMESSGSGARITNGWSDSAGMHFFVWVGNGPGWQYDFPTDPATVPTRLVFERRTYTGDVASGVTRPVGTPSATCFLDRRS